MKTPIILFRGKLVLKMPDRGLLMIQYYEMSFLLCTSTRIICQDIQVYNDKQAINRPYISPCVFAVFPASMLIGAEITNQPKASHKRPQLNY